MLHVQNFINGNFVDCPSTIDSIDPSTGEAWAAIPDSTEEDVDKAVQAAQAAFPGWVSGDW